MNLGLKLSKLHSRCKIFFIKLRYKNIVFGKGAKLGKVSRIRSLNAGEVCVGNYFCSENALNLLADGGRLEIGDRVYMNQNVSVTARKTVKIGSGVLMGNNVVIVDHDHDMKNGTDQYKCEDVVIEEGAWIGANAVILRGSHIGKHCIVAAGSVVKGTFADNTLIKGLSLGPDR